MPLASNLSVIFPRVDARPWPGDLNLLEPRLVESHTTVIIPFDDRVIFVNLLNCAEFSSRLSDLRFRSRSCSMHFATARSHLSCALRLIPVPLISNPADQVCIDRYAKAASQKAQIAFLDGEARSW